MYTPSVELNSEIDRLSTWNLYKVYNWSPSSPVLIFALLYQISINSVHLLLGFDPQALLRCCVIRVKLKSRISIAIDCLVCKSLFSCLNHPSGIVAESVCIIIFVVRASVRNCTTLYFSIIEGKGVVLLQSRKTGV